MVAHDVRGNVTVFPRNQAWKALESLELEIQQKDLTRSEVLYPFCLGWQVKLDDTVLAAVASGILRLKMGIYIYIYVYMYRYMHIHTTYILYVSMPVTWAISCS